ncbi:uncharacterized protein C11orf24 homolog isoform X12 [Lagenorhynchus albirostris]|uniref:uncharacterized protein C11orf24 homolog isoform X12 n=1 Tax=Lagenorhynchus albirostris TaxID=27610 RepID=UPI0028E6DDA7|nr:uncharacterized protein C11orf24 homolog isoform X12 [Lagenorhynchus albirostris]
MSVYTNPQVCVAIPKFSQVTCQGRYLWFALYLLPQFLSLDASSTRVEHLPGSHVCHKACHGLGVPFKAVLASCRAKPRPTSAQCQALSPPRKMAQPGHTPRAAASRSSAKQQGTVSSLRNGRLGASGTAQPCCQLTCKMWTALVLIWVSSWSLSESHLTAPHPRYSVLNKTLENSEQNSSVETITRVLNEMSARMTSVTPSPITLTRGTWGGDPTSPAVTAGTTHRTEAGASATAEGTPDGATSGVPTPPVPASDWQTPSSPHTRAPGSGTLSGPATHTTPTPATGAPTAAAALASAYESYKRKDYTQVDYLINGIRRGCTCHSSFICLPAGGRQESWRAAREAAFPGQVCSHQPCDPEQVWRVVDSAALPGRWGDCLSVTAPRGMLPGAIPGGELTPAFSTTLNPEEETVLPGDSSFPITEIS